MATKEQIESALHAAHAAGDTEAASRLANAYKEATKETALDSVKNGALGFAARGNQAMAALNPWADQSKIDAEQNWVKQHDSAQVGQTLADIAMTLPAGGLAGVIPRVAATGVMEGLTKPGNLTSRLTDTVNGAAGAGIGEGLGSAASTALNFIARPFKPALSEASTNLLNKAKSLGIETNAFQDTGNKTLGYLDSALDYIPSTSSTQAEKKLAQREAWQKALFDQGGETASNPSQQVMSGMKSRLSANYNDIASRNNITVDQQLKDALDQIGSDRNINLMDVNKKGIVNQYISEFNSAPVGSTMTASGYQAQRSLLDKQAKAFANSNPAESQSLLGIRSAMDGAMGRSVSPADLAKLLKTNSDYSVMKSIQKAVDPTTETISPNKLINHLKTRDPNRVIYGRGDQELTDIAKVGKAFIGDKLPDSGTAQRTSMIRALTDPRSMAVEAGGLGLLASGSPVLAAGSAGAGLLSSILVPKAAQKALWAKDGYLSKGLSSDMDTEVINGLTRSKILKELLRTSGAHIATKDN